MSLHHLLILVGLTIEIAGAFVLAADAIGLDRIAAWVASLREVRGAITGDTPWARSTFLDPNRFLSAIGAGSGVLVGGYLFAPILLKYSKWWAVPVLALIGGIAGALVGLTLSKVLPLLIQTFVVWLASVESRVRLHAAGLLGFGLLFVGFLLQFVGTLIDALQRASR